MDTKYMSSQRITILNDVLRRPEMVSAVIPILRLRRSKILFYCHFPDMLLAKRASFAKKAYRAPIDWLEQTTTGMADEVLVNSLFTAETFEQTFASLHRRGIRPSVLYPAVSLDDFDRVPPVGQLQQSAARPATGRRDSYSVAGISGLPPSATIFLSINRFERKKNIGLAIEALSLLMSRRKRRSAAAAGASELGPEGSKSTRPGKDEDIRLVIAGGYDPRLSENCEYLEELRQMAEAEDLGYQVDFLPSFSSAQKLELLSACTCVLYTPENEHFGIVPLEAMAARRPVVACNSGGPRESVVNGETGFLCEPNARSFATAMENFVVSPMQAKSMGLAARKHVEQNFARRVFGDRLNEILLGM